MAEEPSRVDPALVRQWFEKTGADQVSCPVEGHNSLALIDTFVRAPALDVTPPRSVPLVMLVCPDCGYAVFFSAVQMGLLKPETSE